MAEALIKNLEGAMEEIKKLIDMTGDQVRVKVVLVSAQRQCRTASHLYFYAYGSCVNEFKPLILTMSLFSDRPDFCGGQGGGAQEPG